MVHVMSNHLKEVANVFMMSKRTIAAGLVLLIIMTGHLMGQTKGIVSGERYDRLVIRNVIAVDGKGTPIRGPMDIIIEKNRIHSLGYVKKGDDVYLDEAHVLDGSGLYLMPGLINLHAHIHDSRAGHPGGGRQRVGGVR